MISDNESVAAIITVILICSTIVYLISGRKCVKKVKLVGNKRNHLENIIDDNNYF